MRKPIRTALFLAVIVTGTAGAAMLPPFGTAHAGVGVVVSVPPPPLRHETFPPPRAGFIWVPGHWEWGGRHHRWVAGYWLKARKGYHFRSHRWVEHNGGWRFDRGRWDRDGDGIADRYDRHPNNPYRP
jgi:hypothetical protein